MSTPQYDPGSFRDPDTRVFRRGNTVYRCLTHHALTDWEQLVATDFYRRLVDTKRIIPTSRVTDVSPPAGNHRWSATLKHDTVPVISYPYEWSFAMLRDAATLQLELTEAALDEGMTLKDATPYNVQWLGAQPTFIDIGSFTSYEAGEPWAGYRQFCELFLYPLLLQSYKDVSFHPWLRGRLEGISAADLRALLSARDYLRPGILTHVFLQSTAQARYEGSVRNIKADLQAAGFNEHLIRHNVKGLRRLVERLRWSPASSTWSDYSETHGYDAEAQQRKTAFVEHALSSRRWRLVWDLGCNTGTYARLACQHADYVVAMDADHVVIDRFYRSIADTTTRSRILPLVCDLADPSPGLGWRGRERHPLLHRARPDLILCLALVHHLVISRHIPLVELIEWLAGLGADLVIEFVTTDDPKVQHLLRHRSGHDIKYSASVMDTAMANSFEEIHSEPIADGTRILYHASHRRTR